MDPLVVPQGELRLARRPARHDDPLRAWDAADELLLQHVAEAGLDRAGTVLVVNDDWGALATALAGAHPHVLSDSYVAHLATAANLAANAVDPTSVALLATFDPLPERVDLLLVKVPRSLARLEDQLRRIAPHLHPGTIVVGAGMTKHVHTSTLELFETVVGPTRTSRATKKARLVFATPDPARDPGPTPWPTTFPLGPGGPVVVNEAGVFSGARLDVGTRFFLDHLPHREGPEQVVDLGCGNGVVGLAAALADPGAELTFVDESFAAVASAEATFRANLGQERPARFVVGDGLATLRDGPPIAAGSIDLVLCNPPFHVNHAVADATAWQLFADAHRALRPGGELWVVGNRHLAYHAKLKRLFGACDVVASNAKFVVFRTGRR